MSQGRKNRTGQLIYCAFLALLAFSWPTLPCTGAESGVVGFRAPAAWQTTQGAPSVEPLGSFDTPIKEVTVDIAPSPQTFDMPGKLYCHYYPNVLVKEFAQDGQIGVESSMLRTQGQLPACDLSHEPGERAIDWNRVFKGVKDDLVFFDDAETFDGALGFAIYDSITGQMLFTDWVDAGRNSASRGGHI